MNQQEKEKFIESNLISLDKLCELHKKVNKLDVSLSNLLPVAIVENNTFFIFDLDSCGKRYELKLEHYSTMPIPKRVLAAFPLEFYDMKPCAVVSQDSFETLEGYIFIFHEFVHCFQWNNCENEIREQLKISKKVKEESNFMWELNYPFPYKDETFIEETLKLEVYLSINDYSNVIGYYKNMKKYLNEIDYEYMIWQQWKEGFARYIENEIRGVFSISIKKSSMKSFNRESFYIIGSEYIWLLLKNNTNLKCDLKKLFILMSNVD